MSRKPQKPENNIELKKKIDELDIDFRRVKTILESEIESARQKALNVNLDGRINVAAIIYEDAYPDIRRDEVDGYFNSCETKRKDANPDTISGKLTLIDLIYDGIMIHHWLSREILITCRASALDPDLVETVQNKGSKDREKKLAEASKSFSTSYEELETMRNFSSPESVSQKVSQKPLPKPVEYFWKEDFLELRNEFLGVLEKMKSCESKSPNNAENAEKAEKIIDITENLTLEIDDQKEKMLYLRKVIEPKFHENDVLWDKEKLDAITTMVGSYQINAIVNQEKSTEVKKGFFSPLFSIFEKKPISSSKSNEPGNVGTTEKKK